PRDLAAGDRRLSELAARVVRPCDARPEPRLRRRLVQRRLLERLGAARVVLDRALRDREREIAVRGDARPEVLVELDAEVIDRGVRVDRRLGERERLAENGERMMLRLLERLLIERE